jgi:glycosyltransferase involved in cell wall biosynthesis
MEHMRKLLAIGDYPVNTGFGIVMQNILGGLTDYDIAVIGINYRGDPHPLQNKHRIYMTGTDVYGFGRLKELVEKEQPDLIFVLNDIWVTCEYVRRIRSFNKDIPIVVYTPIDSENIQPDFSMPHMDENVTLVTYTNWGKEQIKLSGFTKPIHVVPHGIDREHFTPMAKGEARKLTYVGSPLEKDNPFVVLYVARNAPRKRVDLAIFTIAEWIKKYNRKDVFFHYHGATKDVGYNVEQLAHYYGIGDRLVLTSKNLDPSVGIPLDKLKYLYNAADVYFHACANGGWELPIAEAMSCKVPCIVPEYSALSEWPRGGVHYIPVDRRAPWHNPQNVNTTHYFYHVDPAIEALEYCYQNPSYRKELAQKGYDIITKKEFLWKTIVGQFQELFQSAKPTLKVLRGKQIWKK